MSSAPVRLLSQCLKELSVFYRSQMGRGARIKCIKCPPIELYERIKGFAKLCHKAVNHCHTRLKFLQRWPEKKKKEDLEAVVMGSITSSVKSASTPWAIKIKKNLRRQIEIGTMTQDTTNYHSFSLPGVYLQECCCNSILLTPLLHSSSGFPPLLLSWDVKKKKKKKKS